MKFIKNFKLFEYIISFNSVNFGISAEDLDDILLEITDHFPQISYYTDSSTQSGLILPDPNSFIVELYHKDTEFPTRAISLYFLEPKIFNLIPAVNDKLKSWNLEVTYNDFGSNDSLYELVISKIGTKPQLDPRRPVLKYLKRRLKFCA